MKKNLLVVSLSFIILSLLNISCVFIGPSIKGNGDVEEQTRNVKGFERVKVSHGLEVVLVPDDKEFVIVKADDNLFNVIETEVEGDVLEIYLNERVRWCKSKKVIVHYLELDEVRSSSGSHVYTDGTLRAKSLNVRASSGSHQKLDVDVSRLKADCSSGSHIKLSGKSEKAYMEASSGAHIKGGGFSADDATADVSSGGHVTLKVNESLDGEASSGGHIYYYGNPKDTYVKKSSGGQIRKR